MENRTTNPQNHHIYQASRRAQLPQNMLPQNLCFSKKSINFRKVKKVNNIMCTKNPYPSSHNHGSGKWMHLKGNYYWREPFFTSMIMGGRVPHSKQDTELPLFQQQTRSSASRLRRLELIGGPARPEL